MNEYDIHHFTLFSSPPEIIKSSLGLRRNVAGHNFLKTLDNIQKRELRDIIREAAADCEEFGNIKTYLAETDERKMLADLFFENGTVRSRNWKKKPASLPHESWNWGTSSPHRVSATKRSSFSLPWEEKRAATVWTAMNS